MVIVRTEYPGNQPNLCKSSSTARLAISTIAYAKEVNIRVGTVSGAKRRTGPESNDSFIHTACMNESLIANHLGALAVRLADGMSEASLMSDTSRALLETLHFRGAMSATQLAEIAELTQPSAKRALDKLRQDGLVDWPDAGRTRPARLTKTGRILAKELVADRDAVLRQATSALAPEEREALAALLAKIRIAANTVIMDSAVLRGLRGCPLQIGENVLIGPRAVLNGCVIGEQAFVATGATIFNGATIGERAEVRVNAIVHLRTRLAPGMTVPLGWIAVGGPAQVFPPDQHQDIWAVQKGLNFPSFVFGVERPPEGQTILPNVIPRYAAMLSRRHAGDTSAAIAMFRENIIFEEVDYGSDIARECLSAFAAELSKRLDLDFDLRQSGDPELSQMAHPHGTFIVARIGETPLGCVGVKGDGRKSAEIKRMWITPAGRGLGLARRLMITAETAALDLGIDTLRLDTNSSLFEAVNLYRKMGWSEIERFNDDPYPDLFFEKKLEIIATT